jgi:hypothetical protein
MWDWGEFFLAVIALSQGIRITILRKRVKWIEDYLFEHNEIP